MKKLLILLFITLTLLIQGCGEETKYSTYLSGEIKSASYYKYDKLQKATYWYRNGQVRISENYKDGKLDGKQTDWHENGQISWEKYYKDGKMVGKWTSWYENGLKRFEWNYKDDWRDGKQTWWDLNGQIEAQAIYKDNECSGDCSY